MRVLLLALLLTICVTVRPAQATWASPFASKTNQNLPIGNAECRVCFFEKANYEGERVCIGLRSLEREMDLMPIATPTSIGSIKFFASTCDPVVILRVLVPPFGQRFMTIVSDQPAPQLNDIVQEMYVEWDGTACLVGATDLTHLGRCYHDTVGYVGDAWTKAFYELLLFKRDPSSLDVVLYNGRDLTGKSKRFFESSRDFTIQTDPTSDVATDTLMHDVSSVQFINPSTEHLLI